jgi:predicted SprT family Zn-dependent metalloprotease
MIVKHNFCHVLILKQAQEAAQKVNNWSFLSQQLLSCTDIKTSSRGSSKGKQLVIFVSTQK